MSVDILGNKLCPVPKHGSMLLYVHRNRKAHQDGKPRTATSTFPRLLNSVLFGNSCAGLSCAFVKVHAEFAYAVTGAVYTEG